MGLQATDFSRFGAHLYPVHFSRFDPKVPHFSRYSSPAWLHACYVPLSSVVWGAGAGRRTFLTRAKRPVTQPADSTPNQHTAQTSCAPHKLEHTENVL
jgi:hypothetical protein